MTTKQTASCEDVYKCLDAVAQYVPKELYDALVDAFCDFELSFEDHAKEYHSDQAKN